MSVGGPYLYQPCHLDITTHLQKLIRFEGNVMRDAGKDARREESRKQTFREPSSEATSVSDDDGIAGSAVNRLDQLCSAF